MFIDSKLTPLIVIASVLSWANSSLNRFLIVYVLGLAALGVYAANYSIAAIVSLASLVMNFSAVPHLNNAWNRGDKARVVNPVRRSRP